MSGRGFLKDPSAVFSMDSGGCRSRLCSFLCQKVLACAVGFWVRVWGMVQGFEVNGVGYSRLPEPART